MALKAEHGYISFSQVTMAIKEDQWSAQVFGAADYIQLMICRYTLAEIHAQLYRYGEMIHLKWQYGSDVVGSLFPTA